MVVHELSIAQSLLEIILEESLKNRLVRVTVVRLQVGTLAAVVPDSLTFCFDMLTPGTVAEGAVLEIDTVPATALCPECDKRFEVRNHIFLCPECGSPSFDLMGGRELSVSEIEGETGEENDANQCPCGTEHPSGQ